MSSTIRRLFFVWDFEKQVSWLNEMAEKGLNLVEVGFGRYTFKEGTPGEYCYRMEWLKKMPSHPESIAYIRFMEETGAEYVSSFKKWVYLRKKTSEGAFDIFSDLDSHMDHLKRLIVLILCLFPFLLVSLAFNVWEFIRMNQTASAVMSGMLAIFFLTMLNGLFKMAKKYRQLKNERILRE